MTAPQQLSREEWTRSQRTVTDEELYRVRQDVSRKLADFTTSEDVAQAVRDLNAYRLDVLRRNRADGIPAAVSFESAEIRHALRDLRGGWLPLDHLDGKVPALARLFDHYRAEQDRVAEEYRRTVEARPIDDEAWQEYLAFSARFGRGCVIREVE